LKKEIELPDHIKIPKIADGEDLLYLRGLNQEQSEAIKAIEGPVLVLAGAGTGKTRVLTTRLAHLLVQGKARPWEIMAVTFTNKAAREMQNRVTKITGRAVEGWWLGTFHAICARILRRHAELVGLKNNFTILDSDDQLRLLKQLTALEKIDEKKWPPRALLGVIQRWKDQGLTPDKVENTQGADYADGKVIELYSNYQSRLITLNAVDFGDLILHCLSLFVKNGDVLYEYQKKFQYLLVDEYQDTNIAQYLWLRLLAREHSNICCVGDDDQSIYSWRGAEVGNILKFETDFPNARVIRLEQNYRSTQHILSAASVLISHNEGRLGKTLWTGLEDGEPVRINAVWDGAEEARTVCELVEEKQTKGNRLEEIAILVRAGFQMREFEERLILTGIPYRVIGGPRFYERQEARDAIAYLRIVNSSDDDLAFERIVNVPKRGLGQATVQAIHQLARARDLSLHDASKLIIETDEIKPRARNALGNLLNFLERWRSCKETLSHTELAEIILDESGYTEMWMTDKSPEAPGRLENLKELVSSIENFDNLQGFLEHVSLVMENEENKSGEKLSLMTLHAAKGLEFNTVFLPGWEEGLFPHQRSLDQEGLNGLEEERRLAYVGLTRAKKEAFIFYAANRKIYNQWQNSLPSRFIDELPNKNVETHGERGLYLSSRKSREINSSNLEKLDSFFPNSPKKRGYTSDGVIIDGDFSSITESSDHNNFEVGIRIFHQKFGYGKIVSVDGNKLEVDFEKAGTKKVMDSFVDIS